MLIGEKVVMLTIYYLKFVFANLFTNPYNNVLIIFPGFTQVRKFYVYTNGLSAWITL